MERLNDFDNHLANSIRKISKEMVLKMRKGFQAQLQTALSRGGSKRYWLVTTLFYLFVCLFKRRCSW